MPLQQFTDAELRAKAEQLGLVQPGKPIPTAAMASRVKAAIVEDRRSAARQEQSATEARIAQSIVVQPGGDILIDGEPLPWLVAQEPMDIRLAPTADGVSTVRLTLLTDSVQVLKPQTDSTESE